MKEKKKYTFFQKFIDSIKNIEKYPELAIKSYGEVLLYMVKLLLIFALIISIAYTVKISLEMNKIVTFISQEIPKFTLEDGILSLDDKNVITKENISTFLDIAIIDTNDDLSEDTINKYKGELLNKENGILVLKDKILLKTMATDGVIEYNYSDFAESTNIQKITKNELIDNFSGSSLIIVYVTIFIISFIYIFIFYNVNVFFNVILLVLLGYISTIFMRMRIRFNALCKIAIHSLTLPIILNIIVILVELFTTFRVNYFEVMYIVIASIYIIAAISMIRVDIIKNKQELLDIMEEQKRVKEEIERQEEEKKKEKENKLKDDDKQDEKEKNKEEDQEKQKEDDKEKDAPQEEGT